MHASVQSRIYELGLSQLKEVERTRGKSVHSSVKYSGGAHGTLASVYFPKSFVPMISN